MSKQETVEVKVKIPKGLIEFLEEQHYFGWNKEIFFDAAARSLIGAEMAEMQIDEEHELEKQMKAKYGDDFTLIDMSLKEEEDDTQIDLPENVVQMLVKEADKDGLSLTEEIWLAILCFFKKHDTKIFEEAKKNAPSVVLEVFEKQQL